jgi:hypothetical protein
MDKNYGVTKENERLMGDGSDSQINYVQRWDL